MPTHDQSNAECFVFTFKEGLLSPIAHDLRIKVTRFTVMVENGVVTASFDTASLRVDTPMKDGKENPTALGEADKEKIASQIRDDVLNSSKHPEANFRSRSVKQRSDGGYDLDGDLTLHGVTKPIQARTELVSGKQELEFKLHQPDFGITPFRAMMGTLKIQPDVRVRLLV
jgi:polyisoprenoid-binding protein YceI